MTAPAATVEAPVKRHRGTLAQRLAPPIARHVILAIAAILVLMPIAWTLIIALTPSAHVYQWPPAIFSEGIDWDSFKVILLGSNVPRALVNSTVVSVATTALTLAIAAPAAYRFSRGTFPAKTLIMMVFIGSIMIPGLSNIIPIYMMLKEVGLLNSHLGLVLVLTAGNVPFVVWLLKGFVDQIPHELDEAATIDGANRWQTFTLVILPLMAPGLAAAAVLTLVAAWNEFLLSLTLIQVPSGRTLQPEIQLFVSTFESTQWTNIAAATLVACVPVVIIFIALQRALISGLTAGSIKG